MTHKINPIFSRAANLLKAYAVIQQHVNNTCYKIIDIKTCSNSKTSLIIQVIGKSNIFESLPEAIAADDSLIERFSKKDIRTITYLASMNSQLRHSVAIIEQDFCIESDKITYKLKKLKSGEIIARSASEIARDKNLLKKLCPEDALNIGYMIGAENILSEKQELESF